MTTILKAMSIDMTREIQKILTSQTLTNTASKCLIVNVEDIKSFHKFLTTMYSC